MSTNITKIEKRFLVNTKRLINGSHLSYEQASEVTGVSASTLRRIAKAKREGRTYSPMLKTAIRLADAANASVDAYVTQPVFVQ